MKILKSFKSDVKTFSSNQGLLKEKKEKIVNRITPPPDGWY